MTSDTVWIGGEPAQMEVVNEILGERIRQDEKWGKQNHPMHSVDPHIVAGHTYLVGLYKRINDDRAKAGALSWDGILFEEAYEAFAETDPAKQREGLVQVAAVAVAAIECLDRRAAE